MTLWETIARVQTAAGDDIALRQRGEIFEIRYNGIELMSNLNHHSEDQLALLLLRKMDFSAKRIMIAGLGLGYTLRAVLDLVGADVSVTVCELIPEVVAWNQGPLGPLAAHPLDDPRVSVVVADIRDHLRASREDYDLILLDTDNGPEIVIRPENTGLYQACGMQDVLDALAPDGLAAFWSATASDTFEAGLDRFGWNWRRKDIALIPGRVDAMHHIYICDFDAARRLKRAA